MTFEEALAYKNSLPSAIIEEGSFSFQIFVTPSKQEDISAYLNDVIRYFDQLEDVDAIPFSSDEEFSLFALCWRNTTILVKSINING